MSHENRNAQQARARAYEEKIRKVEQRIRRVKEFPRDQMEAGDKVDSLHLGHLEGAEITRQSAGP
jgi:hypothetical protein